MPISRPCARSAADPAAEIVVDIDARRVAAGSIQAHAHLPDATRDGLLSGAWDATSLLLDDYDPSGSQGGRDSVHRGVLKELQGETRRTNAREN